MQVRLPGLTADSLVEIGQRVRDLFVVDAADPHRITGTVDDAYLRELATALAGRIGGRIGLVPRLYLKKLVGDILDRVDQFTEFDPRTHYALTLTGREMTEVERNAASAEDVPLDVS